MMAVSIPGYRLGDPALPKSPITTRDLADLKESLLFGEDDVAALRKARGVVEDQVEAILDVWYGFVASKPHLLVYFSDPATGQPLGPYLEAVRKRFGQWILDTCDANYDDGWLAWQDEIGRRHHRTAKNKTDGVQAVCARLRVAKSGMPPAGRNVRRAIGLALWPGTVSKRKARTSVAIITTASIMAKFAPMHTRGPAPNGRCA
jgi:Protoglobin